MKRALVTGSPRAGVGTVFLESGIDARVREELARRGHRVERGDGGFGGYQAILRDSHTGVYTGASEMRKDGVALAY